MEREGIHSIVISAEVEEHRLSEAILKLCRIHFYYGFSIFYLDTSLLQQMEEG